MKNLLRKHSSLLVIAVLLACLLGIGTALQPDQQHVAHAGTNGQQIALFNCSSVTNVHIHGTNQSQLPADWYPQNGDLVTHGYWWVGPVTVTYYDPSISQQVTLTDNVPRLQDFDDFYPISCPVNYLI